MNQAPENAAQNGNANGVDEMEVVPPHLGNCGPAAPTCTNASRNE